MKADRRKIEIIMARQEKKEQNSVYQARQCITFLQSAM